MEKEKAVSVVSGLAKEIDRLIYKINRGNRHFTYKHSSGEEYECWGFISSYEKSIDNFLDHVWRNPKPQDKNILDVGCGISPLLLSLDLLGFNKINGVEYQAKLVNSMKDISPSINVVHGNILEPSEDVIQLYRDADYIYSYMPLANKKGYVKAYRKVLRSMSVGSVIAESYARGLLANLIEDEFYNSFRQVDNGVYEKMSKDTTTLENISVSRGTLKTRDVFNAIFSFIRDNEKDHETHTLFMDRNENEELYMLYRIWDNGMFDDLMLCGLMDNNDQLPYILNEVLFDILNTFAPKGYYFGAHVGDLSDFGFWKLESDKI